MPTIRELKEDLQFNTGLIELLEVMKNTAVFRFRALQARKKRFEKFFEAVRGFLPFIGEAASRSGKNGDTSHFYDGKADIKMGCVPIFNNVLMAPESRREAVIIVTSDEGFIGNLNMQVINAGRAREGFNEAELVVIGERGARYLKEMGREFVPFNCAADARGRRTLASTLTEYILTGVKEGRFGRVSIAYPRPVSFMLQKAEVMEILPLFSEEGAAHLPADRRGHIETLIVESPLEGIVDYLAEELIRRRLVDILEDSKLSEFASRAIHLEGSSQELTEKKNKIRLKYFRAYHEMIDKSTRELFAAQLTLHKK